MKREEYIESSPTTILPAGYTQLNYLESNHADSYIMTDFYPLYTFKVSGEFSYTASNGGPNPTMAMICGCATDTGQRQCSVAFFKGTGADIDKCSLDVAWGNYQSSGTLSFPGHSSDTIWKFEASKDDVILNGVRKTHSYTVTTMRSYFAIFSFDGYSQTAHRTPNSRIYWLAIDDGSNNEIHHFIPAMRDSDQKLGMYDIVVDKFYPCTGTFTYGTL